MTHLTPTKCGNTFSILLTAGRRLNNHSLKSPTGCWSDGVYKIPNSKHQITNKAQIPILNDQNRFGILNFGHCDLFDICDL
jgi:hypothetical protein